MAKSIVVKDKYRTNPLSLEPGGSSVTVTFSDGFSQTYDKVKFPNAFVRKINESNERRFPIVSIVVNGQRVHL
jgi:hypothetical protein